ncbi:MAG: fibronectin type III domain-containing protein, partial [Acidimicrobiia bacterium]|nr:fibronectin type III domain-containing protein [Acidimicrobiia bacterium]
TKGTTSDTYSPNADVERDQMASFVLRMYQHIDNLEEAPQPPTEVTVTVSGTAGNQLEVSWTAPEETGSSDVTSYVVQWKTGDEEYSDDRQATVDDSTTWTSPATLTKATTYTFRVAAVSDAGQSEWSDEDSNTPGTAPGAVTAFSVVTGVETGTLDLTWKAPTDDGGTPITGYKIQWATGREAAETEDIDDGTAISHTITGLKIGVQYRVHIQAMNGAGLGAITAPANSEESAVRPATTVSSGSVRVALPPESDPDAFRRGGLFASVTWLRPTNLATGQNLRNFDIQRKCGTENWPSTHDVNDARSATQPPTNSAVQTLTDADLRGGTGTSGTLTNGEECTYRVRANTWLDVTGGNPGEQDSGETTLNGAWVTGSATPLGTPGKPGNPMVEVANGSLNVSWTTPMTDADPPKVDDGGTPITEYKISWSSPTPVGEQTVSAETNSYTITGLGNSFLYTVTIQAINARGAGEATSGIQGTPNAVPAAPTNVQVSQPPAPAQGANDLRGTALIVTWNAPASNGTGAVVGYALERRTTVTSDTNPAPGAWAAVTPEHGATNTGTRYSAAITTDERGTSFDYRVRAINATAAGPWSAPASGTAAALPSAVAQANIEVIPANGSLVVTWAPANGNGSDITHYNVWWARNATGNEPVLGNRRVTASVLPTTVITGLSSGPHLIGITAVNSVGASGQITTDGTHSPAFATAAPATVTAKASATDNIGGTNIDVEWSAVNDAAGYQIEYLAGGPTANPDSDWSVVTPPSGVSKAVGTDDVATFDATFPRKATITDLTAGTTYVVRVRAMTQAMTGGQPSGVAIPGTPGFSAPVKAEATPAGEVGSLMVAQPDKTTSLRVSWEPNTAAEMQKVTGYLVAWYPVSSQVAGNRGSVTVAADVKSYDITGLTAIGRDFFVSVSPVNAIGTGVTTNVPAVTAPPANVPGGGSIKLAPATT